MAQVKPKVKIRFTAEERSRQRIRAEAPTRRRPAPDGDERRNRWLTLPANVRLFVGEQAVVDYYDYVWVVRRDKTRTTVDADGTRHTPIGAVSLGRAAAVLREGENLSPVSPQIVGNKTPEFVSGEKNTRGRGHLQDDGGFVTAGGRPQKDGSDELIEALAAEGLGVRGIARELVARGFEVSAMTVSRRLGQLPLPLAFVGAA